MRFIAHAARQIWTGLASVKLTMVVIPLIVIACMAGTFFPQETANRYVYHAPWFAGLLAMLGLNTLVCMIHRTSLRWSQATFILNHISILVIIAGGVVGAGWGFRGMMQIREGQASNLVWIGKEKHTLPFSLFLEDFQVVWGGTPTHRLKVTRPGVAPVTVNVEPRPGFRAEAGGAVLTVEAYFPDFTLDDAMKPSSRSEFPNNPALYVRVESPEGRSVRKLFAKFPEFGGSEHGGGTGPVEVAYEMDGTGGAGIYIDQFRSDLMVLDGNGAPVQKSRLEVNAPLRYGGYTFYQSGYDEEAGRYTVLQVARDPGVPLVYAGFGLLGLGMLIKYGFEKPRLARNGHQTIVASSMAAKAPATPAGRRSETPALVAAGTNSGRS